MNIYQKILKMKVLFLFFDFVGSFLLFVFGGGGCLFVVFVLFLFFCSNENCRFDVEASFFAMASLAVKFQHTWPVTM